MISIQHSKMNWKLTPVDTVYFLTPAWQQNLVLKHYKDRGKEQTMSDTSHWIYMIYSQRVLFTHMTKHALALHLNLLQLCNNLTTLGYGLLDDGPVAWKGIIIHIWRLRTNPTFGGSCSMKVCAFPFINLKTQACYLLEMERFKWSLISKALEGKHTQYEVCVGTCQLAVGLLACNNLLYSALPHHDRDNQGHVHMWQDCTRHRLCEMP